MRRGSDTGGGFFEDPDSGRPLDLAALRADDALLDALGSGQVCPGNSVPGSQESDRELIALLASWVAQVRPDEDDALSDLLPHPVKVAAPPLLTAVPPPPLAGPLDVAAGSTPSRWFPHVGRRIAAAALLIGLAASGVAFGARNSDPTTAVPGLSRIVFAERARSMAAAAEITDELTLAREALQQGRRGEAAQLITAAGHRLLVVRPEDGRAQLGQDHDRLQRVLAASGGPPAASDLVLAGAQPQVNPKAFIGDLPERNDLVGGAPGTAGGGRPPAPSVSVLADGGSKPAPGSPQSAAGSGPGTSEDADASGADSSESSSSDSSSSEPSSSDSTGVDPTGTDSTSGGSSSDPGSNNGGGSASEPTDATPDDSSPSSPSAPTSDVSTTDQQASPSSDEPSPATATSPAPRSSSATTSASEDTDEVGTAAPPPSSAPNDAGAAPAASAKARKSSTATQSPDFIGPVKERPPAESSRSRAASTSRTSSIKGSASRTSEANGS